MQLTSSEVELLCLIEAQNKEAAQTTGELLLEALNTGLYSQLLV